MKGKRVVLVSKVGELSQFNINKKNVIVVCKKVLKLLFKKENFGSVSLGIVFVDGGTIRKLNKKFRKKDKITDVLSFPELEKGGFSKIKDKEKVELGEVVICLDKAKKQAKHFGNTFEEEVLRLLVHGILHLFGYEHEGVSKAVAKKMFEAEENILKHIDF